MPTIWSEYPYSIGLARWQNDDQIEAAIIIESGEEKIIELEKIKKSQWYFALHLEASCYKSVGKPRGYR